MANVQGYSKEQRWAGVASYFFSYLLFIIEIIVGKYFLTI